MLNRMRPNYPCALLTLALLAGCNMFTTPGGRARDFVEQLVEADAPPPPELASGLAARVALDYLRALHRQGVALRYRVKETKRADDNAVVRLEVELPHAADAAHAPAPLPPPRLGVELQRDAAGAWRTVRWWAED